MREAWRPSPFEFHAVSFNGRPKFTEKPVKSSLGGWVYAFSGMVDRAALLREFSANFADVSPGMVRMEDCESLFSHLHERATSGKHFARHFLGVQHSPDHVELDSVFWLSGPENPAGGLPKIKSNMEPSFRMLQSGSFRPGTLRSLRRVAFRRYGSG